MKRFFAADASSGRDFELSGAEHNHLANVLRVKVGERVIVCCGDEFDYVHEAAKIAKNATQLRFVSKEPNTANPRAELAVFLAAIPFDKLSLVVQKLNELGATRLVLFNADRCNTGLKSVKLDKLQAIAQQSCKQCGRSIPLHVAITYDEPDVALAPFSHVIIADETIAHETAHAPQSGTLAVLENLQRNDACTTGDSGAVGCGGSGGCSVAVVIGPEGGFTPKELVKLRALPRAVRVSLGRRILRAETAAIAAATLVLAKMGEM